MGRRQSLTKKQKEAMGLLQIGTVLEYFDLMLYVHMAFLLNELFFPKTDPHTTALLTAFAFCSTYVFRSFGVLIFGYIGDHVGRRIPVIISTIVMSVSCIIMANLPTYAQIGITASWVVTVCRMVQGVSSLGEIVGAEIYLTESIKRPLRYPCVAFIAVSSVVGTVLALGIASLCTSFEMNWRIAFWIGSGVAAVGSIARTRLRETPEFLAMHRKSRHKRSLKKHSRLRSETEESDAYDDDFLIALQDEGHGGKKATWHFFGMQCIWPICFYFTYIHCSTFLKKMGYSTDAIITHNLSVTLIQLTSLSFVSWLSYHVHPLKILKVKTVFFTGFVCVLPFLLNTASSPFDILIIQAIAVTFALDTAPAVPVFLCHIPIQKRFTYASFTYAISRALMYVVTSFDLIYLIGSVGNWGFWIVFAPVTLWFFIGVRFFEKLETHMLRKNYGPATSSPVTSSPLAHGIFEEIHSKEKHKKSA